MKTNSAAASAVINLEKRVWRIQMSIQVYGRMTTDLYRITAPHLCDIILDRRRCIAYNLLYYNMGACMCFMTTIIGSKNIIISRNVFRLTVVSIWQLVFVHRRPRFGQRCWSKIRGHRVLLHSCPIRSWMRCNRLGRCYRSCCVRRVSRSAITR